MAYVVSAKFPKATIYATEPRTEDGRATHTFAIEEATKFASMDEAINVAAKRQEEVSVFLHDHRQEISENLIWDCEEVK